MVNEQILRGSWQELVGKIRSRWGQISEDELQQYQGNFQELVGALQRHTGESQESIRDFLRQFTAASSETARRWSDQASQYMSQAADTMAAGYGQAGEMVRQRPGQSLLIAFGVGVAAGLLLALGFRSR